MFATSRTFSLVAGACFVGTVSLAFAQADVLAQKLADFKSASQELIKLYTNAKDEAAAKAVAAQIDAAIARQKAAETGIANALNGLDPTRQEDGKLIERTFAEIQAANKAISDVQLEVIEKPAAAESETL